MSGIQQPGYSSRSSPKGTPSARPAWAETMGGDTPSRLKAPTIQSPRHSHHRSAASPGAAAAAAASPCVFSVGDRVLVGLGGTGVGRNTAAAAVLFVGETGFAAGEWVGLALDRGGQGKHDGEVAGRRYFQCNPRCGLFVRPDAIKQQQQQQGSLVRSRGLFTTPRSAAKANAKATNAKANATTTPPSSRASRRRSTSAAKSTSRLMRPTASSAARRASVSSADPQGGGTRPEGGGKRGSGGSGGPGGAGGKGAPSTPSITRSGGAPLVFTPRTTPRPTLSKPSSSKASSSSSKGSAKGHFAATAHEDETSSPRWSIGRGVQAGATNKTPLELKLHAIESSGFSNPMLRGTTVPGSPKLPEWTVVDDDAATASPGSVKKKKEKEKEKKTNTGRGKKGADRGLSQQQKMERMAMPREALRAEKEGKKVEADADKALEAEMKRRAAKTTGNGKAGGGAGGAVGGETSAKLNVKTSARSRGKDGKERGMTKADKEERRILEAAWRPEVGAAAAAAAAAEGGPEGGVDKEDNTDNGTSTTSPGDASAEAAGDDARVVNPMMAARNAKAKAAKTTKKASPAKHETPSTATASESGGFSNPMLRGTTIPGSPKLAVVDDAATTGIASPGSAKKKKEKKTNTGRGKKGADRGLSQQQKMERMAMPREALKAEKEGKKVEADADKALEAEMKRRAAKTTGNGKAGGRAGGAAGGAAGEGAKLNVKTSARSRGKDGKERGMTKADKKEKRILEAAWRPEVGAAAAAAAAAAAEGGPDDGGDVGGSADGEKEGAEGTLESFSLAVLEKHLEIGTDGGEGGEGEGDRTGAESGDADAASGVAARLKAMLSTD